MLRVHSLSPHNQPPNIRASAVSSALRVVVLLPTYRVLYVIREQDPPLTLILRGAPAVSSRSYTLPMR